MRNIDNIIADLDVRLCIKILLDFLEQFEEPLVCSNTINMIFNFMTKECPDLVNVFQNEEVNQNMEKHEFYLMNALMNFTSSILKKSSIEMQNLKNFFLRIALALLKKSAQYSEFFHEDSLVLDKTNLEVMNKDEILKKTRQIFWLWCEEVRTGGESQMHEIEESFKSVSSPLLVKKKHTFEDKRKRAKTEGGVKTMFFSLRATSDDLADEEKKNEENI